GLGKREKFTGDAVRIAGAALARAAFNAKITDVRIELPGEKLPPAANVEGNGNEVNLGRALGEGMQLASFSFDEFKGAVAKANGNNKDKPTTLKVQLAAEARKDFDRGVATARGVNVARTLAATPPNVANPQYLGRYCKRMAQKLGLKCKVIDAKRAEELGMGGLTAVGRAGSTPPALIVMEYTPKRTAAGKNRGKPLLLVGKAITFDT